MPDPKKRRQGAWYGLYIPTEENEDGEEVPEVDENGAMLIETEDSKGEKEIKIVGETKAEEEQKTKDEEEGTPAQS